MGVESEGDDGLSLDSEDKGEDSDEEVEEVAAVLGGVLGRVLGGDCDVVGNHSSSNTPSVLVDGGLGVVAAEEGGIPTIPPFNTQQLAEVHYADNAPPLAQTQQQLVFSPESMHPLQQQGVTFQPTVQQLTEQQPHGGQGVVRHAVQQPVPPQQQQASPTLQSAK